MQQDNSSFWTDIKKFEEQLAKSPDSFCFARLSEVYLKVGLMDDALHTAKQGVAKHPGYIGGQRALAMACNAKGLNSEALAALKLVTIAMPDDCHAQKLLGKLLADVGEKGAARQALETVLEFFPDDSESRMGLESLEFSGITSDASHYDAEDDDEIIEDLEELEELDILDDEFESDIEQTSPELSELPIQEQEPPKELHHDPLSTGTLAELYVKQGFIHKALEIYRAILLENPGNSEISARITELEVEDNITLEPDGVGLTGTPQEPPVHEDNVFEYQAGMTTDTDFDVETPHQEASFSVEPEMAVLSEVFEKEEVFIAPPIQENISFALKPAGTADNALSTLEGWLENIRRLKSC